METILVVESASITGLAFGPEIEKGYSVGKEGSASAGGSVAFAFSQAFGQGGSQSWTVNVASDQDVSVELGLGESVAAQVSGSRGITKVRIVYKAYLTGSVAVNYNPIYQDHRFWALDVGSVMAAAGITNSRPDTEDISVSYYSNAEVKPTDPTKQVMRAVAAMG